MTMPINYEQMYDDFKNYVQAKARAKSKICHESGDGSAWGHCAVGEFADEIEETVDEVLNMLRSHNYFVYELLNCSNPSNYEALSRCLAVESNEQKFKITEAYRLLRGLNEFAR